MLKVKSDKRRKIMKRRSKELDSAIPERIAIKETADNVDAKGRRRKGKERKAVPPISICISAISSTPR